jgi:transcriptional regulator with XRE-family HTH domain
MKKTQNPATREDLEAFRKWLPLSQGQLAVALGIASSSISKYLLGRLPMSRDRLWEWMEIADAENERILHYHRIGREEFIREFEAGLATAPSK